MNYHKMNQSKRNGLIQRIKFDLLKEKSILFAYLFGSFNDYNNDVGFRDIDDRKVYSFIKTGIEDVEKFIGIISERYLGL